jgi:hypothetical protein
MQYFYCALYYKIGLRLMTGVERAVDSVCWRTLLEFMSVSVIGMFACSVWTNDGFRSNFVWTYYERRLLYLALLHSYIKTVVTGCKLYYKPSQCRFIAVGHRKTLLNCIKVFTLKLKITTCEATWNVWLDLCFTGTRNVHRRVERLQIHVLCECLYLLKLQRIGTKFWYPV